MLTSLMRLPFVEAMLTVLVFREWPPARTGDTTASSSVCLTAPSAILLRDAYAPSIPPGLAAI